MSCKKLLPCGHRCLGVKDEKRCFPCINKECKEYTNLFDQCLDKKLKTKWVTPKITFSHCMCSQCNQCIETPYNDNLTNLIKQSMKLYSRIEKQLKERIKLEKIDKDPRISNPKDPYFNKLFDYGMHKISFFFVQNVKILISQG